MDKPIPVVQEPAIDYNKLIDYIEDKYKIDVRDYGQPDANGVKPYLDFWHWFIEYDECIRNECYATLPVDYRLSEEEWKDNMDYFNNLFPTWVREILDLIKAEFGEYLDEEGDLRVWIWW